MYIYREEALENMKDIVNEFDKECEQSDDPKNYVWIVVNTQTDGLVYQCRTCQEIIKFADHPMFKNIQGASKCIFHKGSLEFFRSKNDYWQVCATNKVFAEYSRHRFNSCFSLLTTVCCNLFFTEEYQNQLIEAGVCSIEKATDIPVDMPY